VRHATGRRAQGDAHGVDISATVRSARRSLGLSQRDFAARLGVSFSAVGNWEAGLREPSMESLRKVLALQGLELTARPPEAEPSPELIGHLQLPLTARLRLALGESPNRYHRAKGDAWRALVVLGRLGTAVVQPAVATGIWVPVVASERVRVVVHEPRVALPACAGADVCATDAPPAPSLVPVAVDGPVRVWVLPPAELLVEEVRQLRLAASLLAAAEQRDDADRRAPAHRDPNEWVEAARMLMTKGTDHLERPDPERGRAWRLGGAVSLAQAVRLETWRRGRRAAP
jgi:transcriptional regulator with XRE-family HTH domain